MPLMERFQQAPQGAPLISFLRRQESRGRCCFNGRNYHIFLTALPKRRFIVCNRISTQAGVSRWAGRNLSATMFPHDSLRDPADGLDWSKVGPRLVQSRSKVGPKSVQSRSKVGPKLVQSRSKPGPKTLSKVFQNGSKVSPIL